MNQNRHLTPLSHSSKHQRDKLSSVNGPNAHLIAVANLSQDPDYPDFLVLDADPVATGLGARNGHYGPYVLTYDGRVLDVNQYYIEEHRLNVPYDPFK